MKYLLIFSVALLSFTCVSCGGEEKKGDKNARGGGKDIEAAEMTKVIDQEGIIILDVRTPEEIAKGKIPGAVEMDFNGGNFQKEIASLDKDKPVYIYCAAGGRSKKAQGIMTDAGFKETYNLLGGYREWSKQDLPTE